MNFRDHLLVIVLALILGAIIGIATMNWAAWAGSTVFLGALIYYIYFRILTWRERKLAPDEPEIEEKAREMSESSLVDGVNTDLDRMKRSGDYLNREQMIEAFSTEFNIPAEKARNLYEAGYTRWGDFSEAIPADLMMIPGINPTLSRKIISTVRSRK